MLNIIHENLDLLNAAGLTRNRQVVEIVPTSSYCAVVLDNQEHGWALSYASPSSGERRALLRLRGSRDDPILMRYLFNSTTAELPLIAVRVALVSALAVPLWREPADFGVAAMNVFPRQALSGAETAIVVGFGGLMFEFLSLPCLRALHVMDLSYELRRQEMDNVMCALAIAKPKVEFRISDGSDFVRAKGADLIAITASALCNGTMDRLLELINGREIVFVQGQSGAIHPGPLFNRGVSCVMSSVKPREMLAEARHDFSGARLVKWIEGGIEWKLLLSQGFGKVCGVSLT